MKKLILIALIVLAVLLTIGLIVNQIPAENEIHSVSMKNNQGEEIGTIQLTETKSGVMMNLQLSGLTANGEHAFHIHETADCSPQDSFTNAGGHYNPMQKAHGMKHPEGQHAGDMPNLKPNKDGDINTTVLNLHVTMLDEMEDAHRSPLFDDNGSALVIHAGADDHMSQPSGAAGARIACGEITK
jgi:Cu-Zn family superoxide dismutase